MERRHLLRHHVCMYLVTQSCLFATTRLPCPWDFSDKNTGAGCHALLHGIFPTPGTTINWASHSLGQYNLEKLKWEFWIGKLWFSWETINSETIFLFLVTTVQLAPFLKL